MPASLLLPKISTNVRFTAARLIAPDLAAAAAERLFLTPPRLRYAAQSALDLIDAHAGSIEHKGRYIATWTWGHRAPRGTPTVVLAHGWGGNATHMRAFAYPLLSAGYRVVTYDQPAHGLSEGKLTAMPDFADVLAEIARSYGPVRAVVAHSIAGAAVALAAARGLPLEKAVLIAPPSDLVGYSRRFARWHWMPEAVRRSMQNAIEERYGVRWEELELARLAPRLSASALVIHDRDDRLVHWAQGANFARLWPGARLLSTDGLGHRRILADEGVTRAAAEFIAGRSHVANQAAPALPNPAPLY